MTVHGMIPPEPPAICSIADLAPRFVGALVSVFPDLPDLLAETLRTDQRQRWLYGFGRSYDDDRGIVTFASTANNGWHKFGLAVDFHDERLVAKHAVELRAAGLELGMDWRKIKDMPHVQWGGMRASPDASIVNLCSTGGNQAVWQLVKAA